MQKNTSIGMNIFGSITAVFLTIANLIHLLFTISMTNEQISTGFGYGTDIELAVLFIWMFEAVFIPIIIASVVFLCLNVIKKSVRMLFWTNVALLGILIMQYIITNLFLFI